MAKWQIALALLVAAVALHVIGVARQLRHYRQVFGELSTRWQGSRIGTGRSARSTMAIVVADEGGVVRAARLRQGAGNFARFLPCDDFVGLGLVELRARVSGPGFEAGVAEAVMAAISDIERPRNEAKAAGAR